MKHVIKELNRSLTYNLRQMEENKAKIRSNIESNESLEAANATHEEAISEIKSILQQLEEKGLNQ